VFDPWPAHGVQLACELVTSHPAYGVPRQVTDTATVLLADNPSPMTLDGTNTWVLGSRGSVVVDPGPDDAEHVQRVVRAAPGVRLVLITHWHRDHTGGIPLLRRLTGAAVRAVDPEHCSGSSGAGPLSDGETIEVDDVALRVMATPGHTADSACFELAGGGGVLTGDTVLGHGTTVIIPGDGDLGDYLASLRRLGSLSAGIPVLPGHGPDLPDLAMSAREYLRHRELRLEQIRAAIGELGPTATVRRIVEHVYADVDPSLRPAAEMSVQAQLDYLRQ
jgi:glyoxylase-like metal-dependent hydrolase (beta-lactamase superfamily II)